MGKLVLSVSDIKEYVRCPQLFMYRFVNKLGPQEDSEALRAGTYAHHVLEMRLRGYAPDESDPGDCPEQIEPIEEHLLNWSPPEKWEIIDVEKELRAPLAEDIELVGRLDCVVRAMGGIWHLQHKTIAASKPVDIFAETQTTDWHEIGYQWLAAAHYGEEFKGTILNCIRKLSTKSVAAGVNPFYVSYLHRREQIIEEGMEDIRGIADAIAWDLAAYQVGVRVTKNRMSCGGVYGNSICPYKPVCDGRQPLDSMNFVEITPRYEQPGPD